MKRPGETILGINIRSIFSTNMKRLRRLLNMSQMDLAAEADLALNFISDLENGKKWLSPETLGKLSIALKVAPHQFFVSGPKYVSNGEEMLSMCNDIKVSMDRIVDGYRSRILQGDGLEYDLAGLSPMPLPGESTDPKKPNNES